MKVIIVERYTANDNKKQITLEQKYSFCCAVRHTRSRNVESNSFFGGLSILVPRIFCFSLSIFQPYFFFSFAFVMCRRALFFVANLVVRRRHRRRHFLLLSCLYRAYDFNSHLKGIQHAFMQFHTHRYRQRF